MLGIDADGQYYLNKQADPERDARPSSSSRSTTSRTIDKILYVKAHKDLEYEKVIDALDIAAADGVRVTGLITDQRPGTVSTVPGDNLMGGAAPKEEGGKP